MIDIDFFKNYNDLYGHIEGDKCLRKVAKILKKQFKNDSSNVYRFGGEEFVIILSETDKIHAYTVAEDIRKAIEDEKINHDDSSVSKFVTISIGVATKANDNEAAPSELLTKSDKQLYLAKYTGRNRVK